MRSHPISTFTVRFNGNDVVAAVAFGKAKSKDGFQGAGQKRSKMKKTRYDANGRALPAEVGSPSDQLIYEG